MKMPSVMKHSFFQVEANKVGRSRFDLSEGHKTTFNAGELIPVYVQEVIPGDTFQISPKIFARLATPIYPLMDNMYMDIHFFFVPNRLVFGHWDEMMGAQANPGDSTAYQTPIVTVNAGTGVGFTALSLYDYLGIPTEIDDISVVNLVPRGYNLIYNEWYRDQNLQNSVTVDTGDGPDTISNYVIRTRGKRHDYFTTCLPWPQKGTAVSLPLGTSAPVVGIGKYTTTGWTTSNETVYESDGTSSVYASWHRIGKDPSNVDADAYLVEKRSGDSYPNIRADLSQATSATINELREAFATQQLLELDARGGTRLQEVIRMHFGVMGEDFRLQRPEFLYGDSCPVIVTPIAQQSATSGSAALGDLAGMGTASLQRGGFIKSFVEHGHIIGIVSVRADLTYSQGIPRMFSRRDRYDFAWPVFAHLGEQAVLKQEIYATETAATNAETFGYQERYAEYRYGRNKVTGLFRPNHATTLAAWHLSQEFGSMPTLNDTFIKETPPMSRVKAVTTEPDFIFDSYFEVFATRPLPLYATPGLQRL